MSHVLILGTFLIPISQAIKLSGLEDDRLPVASVASRQDYHYPTTTDFAEYQEGGGSSASTYGQTFMSVS
jgi:hypothetical protein